MSTVSSLLISASSSIVRDLYCQLKTNSAEQNHERSRNRLGTVVITFSLGVIAIVLAMYPQDIVVWINMFAFGGLESAFLWPLVLGLFWSRMNARGALLGVILGLGLYTLCMATGFKFMGFHNILIGTVAGLLFSVIGTLTGPECDEKILRIFFPHRFDD